MKLGLLIATLAFLGACSTPSHHDRRPGSADYNQNKASQFGGFDTVGSRY